jgi:DNA modification methylase
VSWEIHTGDAATVLATMPPEIVHCCVTSPPYWGLRDYGVDGQLGLESTPEAYVERLVGVFREVRRVLRGDGTLWLNLGDSYASDTKGSGGTGKGLHKDRMTQYDQSQHFDPRRSAHGLKPKDLVGIPWRAAFALQADGWYLRSDIIWHKPNPMPESVTDRPTKGHEYVFLLTKSAQYFYDADAVREKGSDPKPCGPKNDASRNDSDRTGIVRGDGETRNRRTVWTIATQLYPGAHFAVMPPALVEPCILAGCPEGGTVLDPFAGAGTVGLVASRLQRSFVGIEINPEYAEMARRRIHDDAPLFGGDV